MQTIQMHLSQKPKIVSELFSTIFDFVLNFEHFQENTTLIAYVFPKLPTTKDVLISMSQRSRLRGPLDRRQGKQSETVIQSY